MTRTRKLEAMMEECARQEQELQFESFSCDETLQLGVAIVERARREDKSVTVDIERNGQQLFHHAIEGTAADNDEWIRRKKRLTNRVGMSSYRYALRLELTGETLHDRGLDPMLYAARGGAFPLTIRNVGVVGAITVSGLPHEQDHALVVESVREFLGR